MNAEDIAKNIEKLYEDFSNAKENREGYILIPSIKGFDAYKVSEDRLRDFLNAEAVHRHLSKEMQDQTAGDLCVDLHEINKVDNKSCSNCTFNQSEVSCRHSRFMPTGHTFCKFYIRAE